MPSNDLEVHIDRFRKAGLTFDPRLSLRPEHGVVRPFHSGIPTFNSSLPLVLSRIAQRPAE